MYNDMVKERYLDFKKTTTESEINSRNQLNKATKTETKLGKDLSTWTFEEITEFIRSLKSTKPNGMIVLINTYKQYTDWCISNGYTKGKNNYNTVSTEVIIDCLDKDQIRDHIVSIVQLRKAMGSLMNSADKFVLLSTFEGWKISDIINFEKGGLKGDVAVLEKRELQVSPELKKIIVDTENEETRTYYTRDEGLITAPLEEGNLLIRPVVYMSERVARDIPRLFLSHRYTNISKNIGWDITLTDIYDSGRLYIIRQIMNEHNISMHDVLYKQEFLKQVEHRYGKFQNRMMYEMVYKNI